jgi:hypothetical protein
MNRTIRTSVFILAALCTGPALSMSAQELYAACQAFVTSQDSSKEGRLTAADGFRAGRCAGFVEAFPAAYMFGSSAARQTTAAPGKPSTPGCYQAGKTRTGEVVEAVIRRYDASPSELRNESAELLILLALRDSLPCPAK